MKLRFNYETTPEYRAAVAALGKLSPEDVQSAYGDASHQHLLDLFTKLRGVKRRKGEHVCAHRLKGNRQCLGYAPAYAPSPRLCPDIPHGDHLSEWTAGGETVAILSQSYGMLHDDVAETLAFCDANGLDVEFSTYPSFHNPGGILSLIFTRKGFYLGPKGLTARTVATSEKGGDQDELTGDGLTSP
jgi:hypothetical protein